MERNLKEGKGFKDDIQVQIHEIVSNNHDKGGNGKNNKNRNGIKSITDFRKSNDVNEEISGEIASKIDPGKDVNKNVND